MNGKKAKRILYYAALSAIIVFTFSRIAHKTPDVKGKKYFVKRVIDGDTIVLSNNERVRYIGINTPEVSHPKKPVEWMGREATAFNKKLVEHKYVRLEYDVDLRDKYGRLLAYVFVDNTHVNAELVRMGYAQVYTVPPNVKYTDLFLSIQREARQAKKGLWSE